MCGPGAGLGRVPLRPRVLAPRKGAVHLRGVGRSSSSQSLWRGPISYIEYFEFAKSLIEDLKNHKCRCECSHCVVPLYHPARARHLSAISVWAKVWCEQTSLVPWVGRLFYLLCVTVGLCWDCMPSPVFKALCLLFHYFILSTPSMACTQYYRWQDDDLSQGHRMLRAGFEPRSLSAPKHYIHTPLPSKYVSHLNYEVGRGHEE